MAEAGLVVSHLFNKTSAAARRLAEGAAVWSLRWASEPPWLAEKPGRRLFHWGLGPVLADFKTAFKREGLDRYLAEKQVELFSFDLGPAARHHLGPLPLSRPLGRAAIFRHTESALKIVRAHYQGPLAAENYNYYPSGLYESITEPEFIRSYLDTFGLGLTLDLAHAAVSAHNLGLAFDDYLEALPLEKTAEIHISRPWLPESKNSGGDITPLPGCNIQAATNPRRGAVIPFTGRLLAADHHQAPEDREWLWLRKVLNNEKMPAGVPVFVEYYGKLSKLEAAQAHLKGLLMEKVSGK